MPTKNVNPNVYMVDENGEPQELQRIGAIDISLDTNLPFFRETIGEPSEIVLEAGETMRRSLIKLLYSNNWLKMHGYPMRRRFKK